MIAMRRLAGRVTTALALVAASLIWSAPAMADVPGFEVNIGESPATFTVEKNARSLTAVVSTDRGGRCRKVRWALVVRTEGVGLDQLRIGRVENDQSFDVQARVEGDAAVVVDTQLDPGELCRGRTVTGRWDIAFTGPDDGSVTFEARAADDTGRVLSSATATSRVVSPVADRPSPEPSESPSPSPEAEEEPSEEAAAGNTPPDRKNSSGSTALEPAAGTPSVLGPGLIVGALLVFLGVGLLLRIRTRNRAVAAETAPPTGFYHAPRRRSS
jgi:hypothetical protein